MEPPADEPNETIFMAGSVLIPSSEKYKVIRIGYVSSTDFVTKNTFQGL